VETESGSSRRSIDRRESIAAEQLSDGHLAVGSIPRFHLVPRWGEVANVPNRPLPEIPTYECMRAASPPRIDGSLDDACWERVTWSEPFGRIGNGQQDGPETRVALLWDDTHLYAAYRAADPDIRASSTVHHDQVYMTDDDVEIFVEGHGAYYELGVNPINTVYEYRWTWVEQLVERRDWEGLEALFKLADFLYYTARDGERLGRVGEMDFDLPGLRNAVQLKGTLNCPNDVDEGWTAEFALPWAGLVTIGRTRQPFPPVAGAVLRIQAYRAHHDWSDPEGAEAMSRSWPGASPFEGYTWSAMGNGNVHNPERWVPVRFVQETA
jgi:hypothetical protein